MLSVPPSTLRLSSWINPCCIFTQRGLATASNATRATVKQQTKASKKKGKKGAAGSGSHIPRELTQIRHALFTRPFKSGKETALQAWVTSERYTQVAKAYYAEKGARDAMIVARLQKQRERMAEACAVLEAIDPMRFKAAMNRASGEAQLIPMQKRMPVDTPPSTIWDEDYKPPPSASSSSSITSTKTVTKITTTAPPAPATTKISAAS